MTEIREEIEKTETEENLEITEVTKITETIGEIIDVTLETITKGVIIEITIATTLEEMMIITEESREEIEITEETIINVINKESLTVVEVETNVELNTMAMVRKTLTCLNLLIRTLAKTLLYTVTREAEILNHSYLNLLLFVLK